MRTWSELIEYMWDLDENRLINFDESDPNKRYTSEFVNLMQDIEYYLTTIIQLIGATPKRFTYDASKYVFYFEYKNHYYCIRTHIGFAHAYIYIVTKDDYISDRFMYSYTHSKYKGFYLDPQVSLEELAKSIKLPRHAKYNIGDIVILSTKGYKRFTAAHRSYKISYRESVYLVQKISYESSRIKYILLDCGLFKDTTIKVPEAHILKISKGI